MRDTIVSVIIAVPLCLFGLPKLVNAVYPASWWFDVRTVQIEDTQFGRSPEVIVDRDINADFTGNVKVVVRPVTKNAGDPPSACPRGRYGIQYKKGAAYPEVPWTLARFQDVPPNPECRLDPGSYSAEFTWERPIFGGLMALTTSATSNIFTVHGYD